MTTMKYEPERTKQLKDVELTKDVLTLLYHLLNLLPNERIKIIKALRDSYRLSLAQSKFLTDELKENGLRDFYESDTQ